MQLCFAGAVFQGRKIIASLQSERAGR